MNSPYVKGFKTNHLFERTELRCIREQLDEESFLNVVADLLGKATHRADEATLRADKAEGDLLALYNE